MLNVLTILVAVAGVQGCDEPHRWRTKGCYVERKLHFRTAEDCVAAAIALDKSQDSLDLRAEPQVVWECGPE
jgi:hypothetical protein